MAIRYLTVTALTKYIKYKFDHDYNLEEVLLEGEISNFKRNSRGHFYFSLKDSESTISAAMFRSYAENVKFELRDGMKVFVKGRVSVYEPSGTYNINVTEIKSDGVGDLYLEFERLKKELEEKGLFSEAHKKPIPRFPKRIGVITSPTGAAVQDIINTVKRRYPICELIIYPTIVQGVDAKSSIVNQIKKAEFDDICDVLIVGRGGGSIEDLWAFNEKVVAEAIYDCRIPIISAVGHEIDYTIADFVADKRAVTPTAGAELATPNIEVLKQNILGTIDLLNKRINTYFSEKKNMLVNMDKRLDGLNPSKMLIHKKDILKSKIRSLNYNMQLVLNNSKHKYNLYKESLENNNPLSIMDKGYSIVEVENKIITNVDDVSINDTLTTRMKNGKIKSLVIEVEKDGK